MIAANVGDLISVAVASVIRDFSLKKGLMNAMNVGNLLPETVTLVFISEFIMK